MITLREAATQALEALEGGADSWERVGPAIDALRAALAEPVQDGKCKHCVDGCPACDARKLPVQEPFALPCPTPKACKAHCCSGNCIPRSMT